VFWNKEVDQDEPNESESGEEKGGLDSPPCTVPIGEEHQWGRVVEDQAARKDETSVEKSKWAFVKDAHPKTPLMAAAKPAVRARKAAVELSPKKR
jgi:hypothetical protein